MMKNDGIYSRYFTSLQGNGRYSLKVNARGTNTTTRLSLKQNRALSIPGYRENGKECLWNRQLLAWFDVRGCKGLANGII